jgi:L-methionine (R)-S-oxide reductase
LTNLRSAWPRMTTRNPELNELRSVAAGADTRETKARRIAELIRAAGEYRWVGIYDVTSDEIAAIAWSGAGDPSFPRFPVTQGLNGAAVSLASAVIVGDVRRDARYLTTLGSTRSEMVVPVKNEADAVVGTIDVESEIVDRFTDRDREFIESCANQIVSLWGAK